MPKWKDLLLEIATIEERYGSSLRGPVSDKEFKNLNDKVKQQFGEIYLPESYIEFLKKVNGLDFNGLVIYGVDEVLLEKKALDELQGFIEINEIWHENDWQKKYIFFGDSDTAWYCYNLLEKEFAELDKPSGTHIQSFNRFDAMLNDAIETVLL